MTMRRLGLIGAVLGILLGWFVGPLLGSGFSSSGSGGGGATSLQTAYNGGASITEAGAVPVAIASTAADNGSILTVDKTPGSAHSGDGIVITMGANSTGNGITLTGASGASGFGASIITNAGTSGALDVETTGATNAAVITAIPSPSGTGPAILISGKGGFTNTFIESNDGSTARVSGASTGALRYNNSGSGTWQVSTQGAAWVDLATGSGGGTLGQAVAAGNIVNSVTASGQITWTTGGTYALGTPEIIGPTDNILWVVAGTPAASTGNNINLRASNAGGATSQGGAANLIGGNGGATSGGGGAAGVLAGSATTSGAGGTASISGGIAVGSNQSGGAVNISMGSSTGNATEAITFYGPPTGGSGSGVNTAISIGTFSNVGIFDVSGTASSKLTVTNATTTTTRLAQFQNTTAGVTDGYVQSGAGNPTTGFYNPGNFCTTSQSTANTAFTGELCVTSNLGVTFNLFKARNTLAAPAVVSASDFVMRWFGFGHDGTTYQQTSNVSMRIDGAPGAGSMPGAITFYTTPTGSGTIVDRMSIRATGNVEMASGVAHGWSSSATDTFTTAMDTGFIRTSAAVVTLGTGAAANDTGQLNLAAVSRIAAATGTALSVTGGAATAGAGGLLTCAGGAGVGTNQNAGGYTISTGASTGTGTAALLFQIPLEAASGSGSNSVSTVLTINGSGFVYAGRQNSTTVGNVSLTSSKGGSVSGAGGNASLIAGAAGTSGGATGTVTITGGGNAIASGSTNGGQVSITGGACSGTTSTGGGGAFRATGGVGGTTSGTGGIATVIGGAAGSNSSSDGGAGGAFGGNAGQGASGSGAGGAAQLQGGIGGGASGAGGAVSIVGGSASGTATANAGTVTISGGNSAGVDQNVAALAIKTGRPTGTGTSNIQMQSGFTLPSGSTGQTLGDRYFVAGHSVTMSNTTATATAIVVLNLPTSNSGGGAIIQYTVIASDGTNFDTATGSFAVACSNKAGTVTATTSAITDEASNPNSGTLTAGTTSATVASQAVSVKIAPAWTVITPTSVITLVTVTPFGQGVTVTAQ